MVVPKSAEWIDEEHVRFWRRCVFCQTEHEFTVDFDDYRRWQGGAYIQEVWPDKAVDERELMVSGTCASCWDAAFLED